MKKRFFLLSTIISSCIIAIATTQATAAERHPDNASGKRKCYPGSKCTGDPNLIHKDGTREKPGMGNKNGAYQPSSPPAKLLTMDSIEKIKGTVKSVNRVRLPNETQIQIVLDTDRGEMTVIVGPARYVDMSRVKLQSGDKILVKGYRIKANGDEMIMASQIEKNGNVLPLLDESRQPLWYQNNNNHQNNNNNHQNNNYNKRRNNNSNSRY